MIRYLFLLFMSSIHCGETVPAILAGFYAQKLNFAGISPDLMKGCQEQEQFLHTREKDRRCLLFQKLHLTVQQPIECWPCNLLEIIESMQLCQIPLSQNFKKTIMQTLKVCSENL